MLQIVQGMYFRDVPLTDTVHRGIFYTNARFEHKSELSFVFGRLYPSTTFHRLRTVTVEAIEHLESVGLDGRPEMLVSTLGDQLLDEIAAVTSFYLNVVCVRDFETARRVISEPVMDGRFAGHARMLRQTFDATVAIKERELIGLNGFILDLVALKRKHYEAAMRAIRQIVAASLIVAEDGTLAYTLMVAALESLAGPENTKPFPWSDYDVKKRRNIDTALEGLNEIDRERVRSAVLANEHAGLKRRFISFVLGHIAPSFYRGEAVGAVGPISATKLPRALSTAYDIRSRNVHALEDLAPELDISPNRAETGYVDSSIVLTLEGMSRLARHVIRRFVARSSKGLEKGFNYRTALPGIVYLPVASQYWIFNADGFDRRSACAYLVGLITHLIDILSTENLSKLVDMTEVLARIEKVAPGLRQCEDRAAMAAIAVMWNHFADPGVRKSFKVELNRQFQDDLMIPGASAYAVACLTKKPVGWSIDELRVLASDRRSERLRADGYAMPDRIDAAIHINVGEKLIARGDIEAGLEQVGYAVETVPGLPELIAYEAAIREGRDVSVNLYSFILGRSDFLTLHSLAE